MRKQTVLTPWAALSVALLALAATTRCRHTSTLDRILDCDLINGRQIARRTADGNAATEWECPDSADRA